MKLTKTQLKKIIKEELRAVYRNLNEGYQDQHGERGLQIEPDKFAFAVHKALVDGGYTTSNDNSLHKAKAYELVAKHLNVETHEIARHYKKFLGLVMTDPSYADKQGVVYVDGKDALSAIG
jgi:hypothetical protein